MRVLITGANGQEGHALTQRAPAGFVVTALSSKELDITDAKAVSNCMAHIKPQLIINAAAYTAVDKAETDQDRAFAVNCQGVAHLGSHTVPVLHLSTDYVFAGDANQPYTPTSPTGPTGVYGASKLAGELALAEVNPKHVIVRTAWVFSAHGTNFVKTMLRLGAERDAVNVVADQQGGPTAALSIANMLWQLAQRYKAQGTLAWGTYHFAGAVEVGLLAKAPTVNPISTAQYPTPAKRPAWSVLDSRTMHNTFGIAAPHWQNDLKEVLNSLKSNT